MTYLILNAGYITFAVGLYRDNKLIDNVSGDKKDSSKILICGIDELLKKNNIPLKNLNFIGVNQGPGPFTSLRVVITTANGISFATGIPLVGVDCQQALLYEHRDSCFALSVVLLNAFNHDVYYALEYKGKIQEGCKNNELLLMEIKKQFPDQPIRFLGNAVLLYKDLILQTFGPRALIPDPLPQEASLNSIAHLALQAYNEHKTSNQLLPLYLKELSYQAIFDRKSML